MTLLPESRPLYRRVFPADLPPELVAVAVVLLAGGLTVLLPYLIMSIAWLVPALHRSAGWTPDEAFSGAIFAVISAGIGIGVLRKAREAYSAGVIFCLISIFFQLETITSQFQSTLTSTMPSLVPGLGKILADLLGIAVFAVCAFILYRRHLDLSLAMPESPSSGDEPPSRVALTEHLKTLDRFFARFLPGGLTPSGLVIALVILRDGMRLLAGHLLLPPSFGFLAGISVILLLIGLVGVIAGVGVLRGAAWAISTAGLFLLLAMAAQVQGLLLQLLQPDGHTVFWVYALCLPLVNIPCYLLLRSMLGEVRPVETPGVRVL